MKIKTSLVTLCTALLFTVTTGYWYWKHPKDIIGIAIFLIAALIYYIITIGTWKSDN